MYLIRTANSIPNLIKGKAYFIIESNKSMYKILDSKGNERKVRRNSNKWKFTNNLESTELLNSKFDNSKDKDKEHIIESNPIYDSCNLDFTTGLLLGILI